MDGSNFIDLLEIPEFLDRSKWTPEQYAECKAAWDKVQKAQRDELIRERRRRDRAASRLKAKREAEAAAAEERRQHRAFLKAQKIEKQKDREQVVKLIASKHITIGQMEKASGLPQKRLKSAIRWLLKNNQIRKASARTYAF